MWESDFKRFQDSASIAWRSRPQRRIPLRFGFGDRARCRVRHAHWIWISRVRGNGRIGSEPNRTGVTPIGRVRPRSRYMFLEEMRAVHTTTYETYKGRQAPSDAPAAQG